MKHFYNRIRLFILLFFVVISIFAFVGIYKPLKEELETGVISKFQDLTYNKHLMLEGKIKDDRNNALSLSSGTGTEDTMSMYLEGKVTLNKIQEITSTHYNSIYENIDKENELKLVARVARDGQLIYKIGDEDSALDLIDWDKEKLTSTYISDKDFVIIQSPIKTDGEVLGYDIIVRDIRPLIYEIQERKYAFSIYPHERDNEIVIEGNRLVSYVYSDFLEWTLSFSINKNMAFESVRTIITRVVIFHIIGLTLVYLAIQFLILRYIRIYANTQYELKVAAEESAQERNLLIDKMTKGFILTKKIHTHKISESYEIVYANSTFKEMINAKDQLLENKYLFDFLPLVKEESVKTFYEILSRLSSRPEEILMDRTMRWWHVSTYSPKTGFVAMICDDITDKKVMDEKLRDNEEIMRVIFEVSGEGLWDWHFDSNLVYHNKMWNKVTGIGEDVEAHLIDEFFDMIHIDDRDKVKKKFHETTNGHGNYQSIHRMVKEDGSIIWVADQGTVIQGKDSKSRRMIGSIQDITERKQAERELQLEKELSQSTLLSVADGIITVDRDGIITLVNPSGEELIGRKKEDMIGSNIDEVLPIFSPSSNNKESKPWFHDMRKDFIKYGYKPIEEESILLTDSGKKLRISKKVAPITLPDGDNVGFVVAFSDITEKHESQKKIEHMSLHDALTGVYNRHSMEDALYKFDTASSLPYAIIMLDLNNLKLANDVFGHKMGDDLLKKTAEFLRDIFRKEDFIARIGGDEFCVLLPNTSVAAAKKIKAKIIKESSKYKIDPITLSLAVGFAVKEKKSERIDDIMRDADTDMYNNKNQNRLYVKEKTLDAFMKYNNTNIVKEKDHNDRVSILSAALYEAIGKPSEEVEKLKRAALLHDIGKITIPSRIFNQTQKLTKEEIAQIRTHPQASHQILRVMRDYEHFAEAVLYHHERVDGTGYPEGLIGNEIPLEARIIAIADAYEAMTSDRPYKKAMSKAKAIKELRACSGNQFDHTLVEIFIDKVL